MASSPRFGRFETPSRASYHQAVVQRQKFWMMSGNGSMNDARLGQTVKPLKAGQAGHAVSQALG
jgi:hypothetical protein